MISTIGSVCSGIEAASIAWNEFSVKFEWFSEIADFPADVLSKRYNNIPNIGDMNNIDILIRSNKIKAPDLICGGTPCQAFSLAGIQNGLEDERGNLTLKFVDIVESNDIIREKIGKEKCKVLWENVEGVLTDKTNAFGCFISSLAGLDEILTIKNNRWPKSGLIRGNKRNIAWRVLDAKYFGLPQQRRRVYVLAGGKEFNPEAVLFEESEEELSAEFPTYPLSFEKEGHKFEIFREYTDCLYSSYGTKWNGNAAAYNGSLYIVQDDKIRRLSPLECERLMGFPDNYTNIPKAKKTNRYQAIGNSWAIPVIKWIGNRLINEKYDNFYFEANTIHTINYCEIISNTEYFFNLGSDYINLGHGKVINTSSIPQKIVFSTMQDIVSSDATDDIYISPVGCFGIIRRKNERNLKMNKRLEEILIKTSSRMTSEEIEKKSRIQPRGKFDSIHK